MNTQEALNFLTEHISINTNQKMGYWIQSLHQSIDSEFHNIFTLIRFGILDSKMKKHDQILGTNVESIGTWVDIQNGNAILENAIKDYQFVLDSRTIILPKDPARLYLWRNGHELIWNRDSFSDYGISTPATIAYYTNSHQMPYVDPAKLLSAGHKTLPEYIKSKMISITGRTHEYRLDVNSPGIFIIIPHLHAMIDNVESKDSKINITVKTDLDETFFSKLSLTCHISTLKGEEMSKVLTQDCRNGNTFFGDVGEPIKKIETDLIFEPCAGLRFQIDKFFSKGLSSETIGRLIAHRTFYKEVGFLEKNIDTKEPKEFEWAISTLFHLAGYGIEWWGARSLLGLSGPKLKGTNEIDILAFNERKKRILAIECTTKDGDLNKKISSISSRLVNLEKALPEWNFQPLICTNMSKEQLEKWMEIAGQKPMIKIFSSDDLKAVLKIIEEGLPFELISEHIERLPTYCYHGGL